LANGIGVGMATANEVTSQV